MMASTLTQEQKNYSIKINYYKCIACGDCVTACPVNLDNRRLKGYLDESDAVILVKNSNVQVMNEKLCTGCGTCIPACPVKAIDIIMNEVE